MVPLARCFNFVGKTNAFSILDDKPKKENAFSILGDKPKRAYKPRIVHHDGTDWRFMDLARHLLRQADPALALTMTVITFRLEKGWPVERILSQPARVTAMTRSQHKGKGSKEAELDFQVPLADGIIFWDHEAFRLHDNDPVCEHSPIRFVPAPLPSTRRPGVESRTWKTDVVSFGRPEVFRMMAAWSDGHPRVCLNDLERLTSKKSLTRSQLLAKYLGRRAAPDLKALTSIETVGTIDFLDELWVDPMVAWTIASLWHPRLGRGIWNALARLAGCSLDPLEATSGTARLRQHITMDPLCSGTQKLSLHRKQKVVLRPWRPLCSLAEFASAWRLNGKAYGFIGDELVELLQAVEPLSEDFRGYRVMPAAVRALLE